MKAYCSNDKTKSVLGFYLQHHWNPHCSRHFVSIYRLLIEPNDCAGAAMALSSVSVVSNSWRLKWLKL